MDKKGVGQTHLWAWFCVLESAWYSVWSIGRVSFRWWKVRIEKSSCYMQQEVLKNKNASSCFYPGLRRLQKITSSSAYGMWDGVFSVVRRCSLRAQIASFCSLSIVIFRQISPALLHGLLHFLHSFWPSACAFQADKPPCCSRSSTYFPKALEVTRTARPIWIVGNSPVAIVTYNFEGNDGMCWYLATERQNIQQPAWILRVDLESGIAS